MFLFMKGSGFMKRARKGFTLIEVICVLTIIAIIAAVAVPNISGYVKRTKDNNCRSIMNDFVNDIEYSIVSRRYYDVEELNRSLVGMVEKAAKSELEPETVVSKNDTVITSILTTVTSVDGICPNGGKYSFGWEIIPQEVSGEAMPTARVDVNRCTCDCGEEALYMEGHEFTAALVSDTGYTEEVRNEEEIFKDQIDITIDKIEDVLSNPSTIPDIVEDINDGNSVYKIAGVSVGADGEVEWISMYYQENYNANNEEENTYRFFTFSKDNIVIETLTNAEYNDPQKWPPAEGTAGSYVYKEGWDTTKPHSVADKYESDSVSWIQRDGNWYVQVCDDVKGIDLEDVTAENKDSHILISEKKPDSSKELAISKISGDISSDNAYAFKNSFNVAVEYDDGLKENFSHMVAWDVDSESKPHSIRNGFIIVESKEAVSDTTWAGIFSDPSLNADEKSDLKELLDKEEDLIKDFMEGRRDELTVAYQEYHKVYDGYGYRYEPVTVFGVIGKTEGVYKDANIEYKQSEGNTTFTTEDLKVTVDVETNLTLSGTEEPSVSFIQKQEVSHMTSGSDTSGYYFVVSGSPPGYPENGDADIIDRINSGEISADIYYHAPGMEDVKIGTISTDNKTISMGYDGSENDNSFDPDKINVSMQMDLVIRDNKDNCVSEDTTIIYDIPHMENESDKGGYYISDETKESGKEAGLVDEINSKASDAYVYYKDPVTGETTVAGEIKTQLKNIHATYDNNANDSVFSFDGLDVTADYVITILDAEKSKIEEIEFSKTIEHKEADVQDGYLITDTESEKDNITPEKDAAAVKRLVSDSYEGKVYIQYTDGETRSCYVDVKTRAKITPNEYVTYKLDPTSSTTGLYMIEYRGSNQYLDIPEKVKGYWSPVIPDGVSEDCVASVSTRTGDIYYIDDGNEYTIEVLGKPIPDMGPGVDYTILFPENGYQLKSLKMSDAVEQIGTGAFRRNSFVEELVLGNKLKKIGSFAFQYMNGVDKNSSLTIPETIEYIGDGAFYDFTMRNGQIRICGVTDKETHMFESRWFRSALFSSIYFGSEVKLIGSNALPSEALKVDHDVNQNIDESINGTLSFADDSVVEIKDEAFKNIQFNGSLILPSSLQKIGNQAFYGTSFEGRLDLKNVSVIGEEAFAECQRFKEDLVIPESVVSIGKNAFMRYAAQNQGSLPVKPKLIINAGTYTTADGKSVLGGFVFTGGVFGDVIIGGKVSEIDDMAFKNSPVNGMTPYSNITGSLVIGNNVTRIGNSAFENCTGFSGELDLPDRLMEISDSTFSGCINFTGDLTIPSTVITIGSRAFMDCVGFNGKLTLIDGGVASLKKIGMEAFKNCKMFSEGLVIPGTVTDGIGLYAFQGFGKESDNPGPLDIQSGTYSNGTKIGAFIFNDAKFHDITIGGNVKDIDSYAFRHGYAENGSTITADYSRFTGSLTFESGVDTIGYCSFYNCSNLDGTLAFETNADETDGVSSIAEGAFRGCERISGDLYIPGTVKYMGRSAFKIFGDGTGSLTVHGGSDGTGTKLGAPEPGTDELNHPIFSSCKFTNVTIGGNVKEICIDFMNNDLTNIYNLQPGTNEYTTFDFSDITGTLTIEDSVQTIAASAFKKCNFTGELNLNKVTTVGSEAFRNCEGFTGTLSIPEVITVGDSAFESCKNLTGDLTLDKVQTVGNRAFMNCTGFNGRLFLNSTKKVGEKAFSNCRSFTGGLYIPTTLTDGIGKYAFEYFAADVAEPGELILLSGSYDNGTKIGELIFPHSKFRNISIGGNISYIGSSFMNNLSNGAIGNEYADITGDLNIGMNVETIADNAFICCAQFDGKLTLNADIPGENMGSGVKTIGENAFNSCTRFSGGLTVPETVESIGNFAFKHFAQDRKGTTEIGELHLRAGSSDSGKTIDPFIFPHAHFNNVYIEGKVENISDYAFFNIGENGVTKEVNGKTYSEDSADYFNMRGKLTIADGVKSIGRSAFANVSQFDSLVIPESVTKISTAAFRGFGSGKGPLEIYGCSSSNKIEGTIFLGAGFKDVTVGGVVKNIDFRFMKNLAMEKFWDGELNQSFDYDYSRVTGKLNIIDNTVEIIGEEAFLGVNFDDRIHLGTVHTIKHDAFADCKKVKGGLVIPDTVTTMGERAFKKFAADSSEPGELIVRGYSENDSAHTLGYRLFSQSKFTGITIEGNVKTIGDFAFYTSDFPSGGEQFEDDQDHDGVHEGFTSDNWTYKLNNDIANYRSITGKLTIGGSVEKIGYRAFGTAELTELSLDNGHLRTIGPNAFNRCTKIKGGLVIPETVTSIGRCAFKYFASGLNEQDIGPLIIRGCSAIDSQGRKVLGNASSGDGAPIFPSAKFKDVYIDGTVQVIEQRFMDNCYFMPGADTSQINDLPTYDYTNIKGSLYIGDNVEEIGRRAFYYCNGFTGSIKLGNDGSSKLKTLKTEAFAECINVSGGLTVPVSVRTMEGGVFKNYASALSDENAGPLVINGSSVTDSKGLRGLENTDSNNPIFAGGRFRNIKIAGEVVYIAHNMFNNDPNNTGANVYHLTGTLEIGPGVDSVNQKSFYHCRKLDGKLILHDGLRWIGESCFDGLAQIYGGISIGEREFIIPESVEHIGKWSFYGFAQNLWNPPSVKIYGCSNPSDGAFGSTEDFSTINIFSQAHIKNLTFGGKVKCIAEDAFNNTGNYSNITGILTFESSVKNVWSRAFQNCTGITEIRYDKSSTKIMSDAFKGCNVSP
ncbi:MAG: prepilin-type N-terminal cleavage/methylation domain-containing protein [Ruminococcus sp.]|nr:prepilin-type N-terminal cleavage/methylation domain-containing protein [Ruminococcus sp.]